MSDSKSASTTEHESQHAAETPESNGPNPLWAINAGLCAFCVIVAAVIMTG